MRNMTKKDEAVKGSCPSLNVKLDDGSPEKWGMSTWISYLSAFVLICSYCVFLYDRNLFSKVQHVPGLASLETLFDAVERYSPFHEYLMDDDYLFTNPDGTDKRKEVTSKTSLEESDKQVPDPTLITLDELKKYDGSDGSPGLYIAVLGQVFDVSKGKDHYGPGGGYSFFAAKDGSRAFVTGEFNEAGLIDDVTGLDPESYLVSSLQDISVI
jgi:predicted heme/steroid binding protein